MAQPPVLLKDMKLMDVKLGQLPSWLAMRDFTPGGILGAIKRGCKKGCRGLIDHSGKALINAFCCRYRSHSGHDRYYNKYINVKKGGLGGISMVLAGYVVLSYIWSYSHLKHDRRRKYH